MVNLFHAALMPRLGLAIGVFMLWAVFFFAIVDTDVDTAENVSLVPILLCAVLFGVRGGIVAGVIGMLAISTFHIVAGTDVFTTLLHDGSPPDVVLMFAVSALVGYGRILETGRAAANQRATSTESRFDQLDKESQLLSRCSIEISKAATASSLLDAARAALCGIVSFDRMAVYLLNDDKNSVTLSYLSGDDRIGPAQDDVFTLDDIMGIDPYDSAFITDFDANPETAPTLILHRSISDGIEPFAYLRLWSSTGRELSIREKDHVRSVTNLATPALKRAALQVKVEHDAKMSALVADFAAATHRSLEISEVVEATSSYIIRGFRPDYFAISVSDSEFRQLTVMQAIGEGFKGFSVGDVRSMAHVMADPMSDEELRVWTADECDAIKEQSEIALAATESRLDSFIAINLTHKGELLAQLWIGTEAKNQNWLSDFDFIRQIGQQLVSALYNAMISESLRELQRQLVGQNETLIYMQDVVERIDGDTRIDNEQLVELSGSKTQFMSAVAHELKNPLAVIIGYADLLRFEPEKLDSEQKEFVNLIEKSGRQMEVLISELGDVSRIESGNFAISKTPHNITKVVKDIVHETKISILGQNRQIEISGDTEERIISGDPFRLGQVLTNLITNALKYSSEDAPVEITFESDIEQVQISVIDHGLGISEADQAALYTPFFRSNNPEALLREGTGLGLVLAKTIVEEHGGKLILDSVLGSGSTFTIELPVSVTDQNTEAA